MSNRLLAGIIPAPKSIRETTRLREGGTPPPGFGFFALDCPIIARQKGLLGEGYNDPSFGPMTTCRAGAASQSRQTWSLTLHGDSIEPLDSVVLALGSSIELRRATQKLGPWPRRLFFCCFSAQGGLNVCASAAVCFLHPNESVVLPVLDLNPVL